MHFTAEHEAFRDSVRDFVAREIAPHVAQWDEAEGFPRELYAKAAQVGLLGIGYPEEYGGTPADGWYRLIATEEIARAGSGGLMASLFSHNIGLPPVIAHGSEALKRRIATAVLAGERISALAITEPSCGSDVARLRCTARLDGDSYVIDGEKVFITSGLRADWITLAVRTGGPGASGISLIAVNGDAPGLTRTPLAKMGWWCSDTAMLRFDGCRVPAEQLIGEPNAGFAMIMHNFNAERLLMAGGAVAFAQVCYDEALAWARQRRTFGTPLVEHQVIRHRLMEMRVAACADRAAGARRGRCHLGGRHLPAQEPGDEHDAAMCRRRRADPRRHGLHARHRLRTDLPRSEGDDDRRRCDRDHERAGRASAGGMRCRRSSRR
jgi:acyl-CoA dehydrogenase